MKRFYPLIALILFSFLPDHTVAADSSTMKTLFTLTGDIPATPWSATNDGVMGGLSQGAAQLTEEGMCFSGVLSLENNGGFSSVYASGLFDLSDYAGIRFSVLGDGRSYQLRLNSDAMFRSWSPVSFLKEFTTIEGQWLDVFVPFAELQQSWRGRELSGYVFNPAKIQRIGFMLADKQPGPFELTVRWLGADL